MDGRYYHDPQCFHPERFSEENMKTAKSFTFMPFGVGPRNCIGYRFALLEMKVFLYHIVLNFEIMRSDKTSEPLRLRPHHQIRVVGDTWVKFRKRN
ncbi:Cytochrome P450 9e2 [Eumeta japonica]|uniref:unspecific monooxygenase n=1 Tax=Eumeta variegata TaxID=151549 RepID=A0A4C1YSZ1_EUMVA|nr:Cytochrome P450 9e2 [Eumeta japonica]